MIEDLKVKRWHDFRRTLAIGGIGFWFLLGAFPLISNAVWLVRGDKLDASVSDVVLTMIVPAVMQTVSAGYAVAVLRAADPARSRRLCWLQLAWFAAGLLTFLAASAAYS